MKYGYKSEMKSIKHESHSEFQESHTKVNKIKSNQIKEGRIKNQNRRIKLK